MHTQSGPYMDWPCTGALAAGPLTWNGLLGVSTSKRGRPSIQGSKHIPERWLLGSPTEHTVLLRVWEKEGCDHLFMTAMRVHGRPRQRLEWHTLWALLMLLPLSPLQQQLEEAPIRP